LEATNTDELGLTYNAHTCSACKGYWLGPETLKDIESHMERCFVEFRKIPSEKDQMQNLHCPACSGLTEMTKVASKRDSKVIMDVCSKCGKIWLDGGEREAIEQESLMALIGDLFRS